MTSTRIEEKHQDMFYAIKQLLAQSSMKYKLWHVIEHKDNHKELLNMDEGRENVMVDYLAKKLRKEIMSTDIIRKWALIKSEQVIKFEESQLALNSTASLR